MVVWGKKRAEKADRARVLALHEQRWSNRAIAERLRLQLSFVKRTISDRSAGFQLADRPRSGRPRVLSAGDRTRLVQAAELKPHESTRQVAARFHRRGGGSVSTSTVRRVLRQEGLKPYHQRGKPELTAEHIAGRLAFARDWVDHDISRWVFEDEATVVLRARPNRKNDIIWARSAAEVPTYDSRPSSVKVNVMCAIGRQGPLALCLFDENLTGELFVTFMEEELVPQIRGTMGDNFVLVMDNASTHTSAEAQEWLCDNLHRYFGAKQFPAYSPDLNLMDNTWSILKHRVRELAPKTLVQLRQAITRAWTELEPAHLVAMFDSYPARCQAVIRARGGNTRY
jgi:transposase